MMVDIESIKRDGAIEALSGRIATIQHGISQHAWNNTKSNGKYKGLEKAIDAVELHLQDMRALLHAIQALDMNQD